MLNKYVIAKGGNTTHNHITEIPKSLEISVQHRVRSCAVGSKEYLEITSGNPYLPTAELREELQNEEKREYVERYHTYEYVRETRIYNDYPIQIHQIKITDDECLYEYSIIENGEPRYEGSHYERHFHPSLVKDESGRIVYSSPDKEGRSFLNSPKNCLTHCKYHPEADLVDDYSGIFYCSECGRKIISDERRKQWEEEQETAE